MGPEDLPLPSTFGPYQLVRLIGAGGMARVYEARLSGLHGFEKRLAIKMMLPEHAGDTEFVTMLIDEAKIAVALNHSNICQVQDLGCIDDRYYIAMEYVEGADLNKVVNRSIRMRTTIPFDVVAQIGQDICSGLDYAHAKTDDQGQPLNIIHRDISPANILISMSGEVKIVDFGVAKAAHRSQHTTVGVVKGKYQYMSPEQVTGRELDHRSDIFAAGIVLYETIAGRMMYPEGPDMLDRIRLAKMRPLNQVRPDVPPGLDRIIKRALSRRPEDRYQSGGEMGEALAEFRLIYQTRHGRGRLDELMEKLFGQQIAAQRKVVQVHQERASKPPTPKHVPPASPPKPEIIEPSPPPWQPPPRPSPRPATPPRPPATSTPPHRGATTDGLDWDDHEEATRAEPERRPPLPPDNALFPRWSQASGDQTVTEAPSNPDAASPFDKVPEDFDEDDGEDEPTQAFDSTGSGEYVSANDDDDEWEYVDEDEPENHDEYEYEFADELQTEAGDQMYTVADKANPLLDLMPVITGQTESTLRQQHPLTVSEDTIELTSTEEELDAGLELDIDIDLSQMGSGKGRTAAYFLLTGPDGKTSGPFSRAQLHDMAHEGALSTAHRAVPAVGSGVPRPLRGAQWSPAALFIFDEDTEFEAQIALQIAAAEQTYDLRIEPAARLFLQMAARRRSGVLIFDRPGVHKEVTFINGQPTYATSNLAREQLGTRLVELGLLTPESLAHALERGLQYGETLPVALRALGTVKSDAIDSCIERLIRGRLLELFGWTSGLASYHPGTFDAAPLDLVIEPLQLIKEGVQSIAGPDGASSWLRAQSSVTLILTGDSRKPLEFLGIPNEVLRFLDRFATPMSVQEVIEVVVREQLDDEEIAQAILVAFQVGYLAAVTE